jgi:hypothetical protein
MLKFKPNRVVGRVVFRQVFKTGDRWSNMLVSGNLRIFNPIY